MGADPAPRRTLAARLEERDRSRFTGRGAEIAFLDECLDSDDPPASVVHICGPGGIGKSTLLRQAARHARDRGITVVTIDGRELGPAPGALELALRAASKSERPLVLLAWIPSFATICCRSCQTGRWSSSPGEVRLTLAGSAAAGRA
jgi:sugar/nucleoside kinase (ribokinase family)